MCVCLSLSVCMLVLANRHTNDTTSAPCYTDICGLSGLTVFILHFPHKSHDFRKKLTEKKIHFNSRYAFYWNISLYTKNSPRYNFIFLSVLIWSTRYFCRSVMKRQYSRRAFERSSYIKFHENPSSGSRVFTCGQTDNRKTDENRDSQQPLFTTLRSLLKRAPLLEVNYCN